MDNAADYKSAESMPAGKGGHDAADWIQTLACLLAPDRCGPVDTALLGGSFNPAVARQLMVGDRVKAALTLGL